MDPGVRPNWAHRDCTSGVAVANPFALAEESAVNKIVPFAGQVIAGALLSLTEMLCEQLLELLHPSVAVNERVMR